jgi:hypothetical protein
MEPWVSVEVALIDLTSVMNVMILSTHAQGAALPELGGR